nr:hypothetical protein [Mucilaginibacter sp. SP1R1]
MVAKQQSVGYRYVYLINQISFHKNMLSNKVSKIGVVNRYYCEV